MKRSLTLNKKGQTTFIYRWCSLYVAFFLVLMSLGQLFAYEDMPTIISGWGLIPVGLTALAAALLVVLQVASLPALLAMPLPPLVRRISSLCGWIVLGLWGAVSVWLLITSQSGESAGIFGSHVHVPAGLWLVGFTVLLLTLRIAASLEYRKH